MAEGRTRTATYMMAEGRTPAAAYRMAEGRTFAAAGIYDGRGEDPCSGMKERF